MNTEDLPHSLAFSVFLRGALWLCFLLTLSRFNFKVWEMKEAYLSRRNHKEKIHSWMKTLRPQRERHPEFAYTPGDSLLLVIDMQNYFIDDDAHAFIPVGRFILEQTRLLVAEYHRRSLPVVFTRYCVGEKQQEDIMLRWWGEVLLCDEPLSHLRSELDTSKGTVIQKPGYSAFFRTDLNKIIKKNNVTQIVITGVMTHLCCETTAREAFQRGYEVYFVIDATGTYDERIHTGSLFNLAHGFAVPVSTGELLRTLKR